MFSDLRITGLAALLCLTGTPVGAEDTTSPQTTDAQASPEDVAEDTVDPNCSAEEKRRRRSENARAKRMIREAIATTRRTVADAEVIATEHWEETDRQWFAETRDQGR
ncbi:MAG: hypothetical protein VX938_03050, partial [Myxococcota bacterium]|nr:hypothetical protein [Myxococcota bacterium]